MVDLLWNMLLGEALDVRRELEAFGAIPDAESSETMLLGCASLNIGMLYTFLLAKGEQLVSRALAPRDSCGNEASSLPFDLLALRHTLLSIHHEVDASFPQSCLRDRITHFVGDRDLASRLVALGDRLASVLSVVSAE